MTLGALKAQVFELIERELVDPDGVDAALAAVPGGRGYFERIKDGLRLAALLPREEPPAALNQKILAMAGK
mgnify:FL=1